MTINSVHTSCKNCAFAKYEQNTQTECNLDYISKYKNIGSEIIEVFDNEKEFYVINNKRCIGYRDNEWFDKKNMSNSTIEEKIIEFNKTNYLNYILVINLQEFTINEFEKLCDQISKIDIKPQKIIFIRHRDEDLSFSYEIILSVLKNYKLNITWRIQTIVDEESTETEILYNIVVLNPYSRFICYIKAPCENFYDTIIKTNNIIYNDLGQFIVAGNTDKTCVIFGGLVFKHGILNNNNILNNPEYYTI